MEVDSPLKADYFRASDFTGVEESQLRPITDLSSLVTRHDRSISVTGLFSDDFVEEFEYSIYLDSFQIELTSNGATLLTVNPAGTGI